MEKPEIRRGEIWFHKTNRSTSGNIQSGSRPVIIVSNDLANKHSPVLLAVPLTTRPKKNLPTHVLFTIDGEFNTALVEQAGPISAEDLVNKKYILEKYIMDQVDEALAIAYGLKDKPSYHDTNCTGGYTDGTI